VKKPDGAIQLDVAALYATLDAERQLREMTLEEVADELRICYSTLACWRRGGGMNADALVRLSLWLPRLDLRAYARQPADSPPAQREAA